MPRSADLVSFETCDAEIQKLLAFLRSLGVELPAGGDFSRDAYEAFSLLYYHVFTDEHAMHESGIDLARTHAGLGDIASKINKAIGNGVPEGD